jgi:serine/threonine protein kinase
MSLDDRTTTDADAAWSHDDELIADCHYRTLLPVGSGGSATLSIALAEGIGGFSKLVVLKTIRDELAQNARATRMFLDEGRLSARMNHPNVVQVYEVFLQRNVPVIVMEFLDGQPLSSVLAQADDSPSASLELAMSILAKVLAGLHYAHTLRDSSGEPLGLIHRDVSPHNVMVTYDGLVKLIDFGIAKLARSEHRTRTGVVKGKLTYMAPEQFTGTTDHRADIFSVGVMLWEFATRQRYWGDLLEPAIIGRLVSGHLPHLRAPVELDADVGRICARALAPLAEDRYATAAEMQADLERYLAARGAVITERAIGQLVSETCAEARKKMEAEIRGQLSVHGLSLTDSGDGLLSSRIRPKTSSYGTGTREHVPASASQPEAASGERVRALASKSYPHSSETSRAAPPRDDLPMRAREAALRALSEAETREFAPSPEVLRRSSAPEELEPLADEESSDGAPLRLIGGATPTARVVVAIAGFGTIAALVLALGLAAPEPKPRRDGPGRALETAIATAVPAPAAPNADLAASQPQASRIRIVASAQPATATWYLDGLEMGSNPLQTSATKDMLLHTLRAEAKGFTPFVKTFRFDANVDVTVVLAPE